MTSKTESNIQNEIRLAASENGCTLFRANSGKAWQGSKIIRNKNGSITIENPRPFLGMISGFSDLCGVKEKVITQDMVGQTVGIAVYAEVKTAKGKARDDQVRFLAAMQKRGALAGIVRSVDDLKNLVK